MSKQENEKAYESGDSAKSTKVPTPQSVSLRIYKVITIPVGCEDYAIGDLLEVYAYDPPAQIITLYPGGPCDGSTAELQP